MFRIMLIATIVAVAFAGECKPAKTDFEASQCLENPPISITNVGLSPYPANPSVPLNLTFTYDDTTPNSYNDLRVDVTLEYFGELLFYGCGFHRIPIPADNIKGCSVVDDCPLLPGVHANSVVVDLTPFAGIIKTLAGNTYYRLNVTVKASDETTKLACMSGKIMLI